MKLCIILLIFIIFEKAISILKDNNHIINYDSFEKYKLLMNKSYDRCSTEIKRRKSYEKNSKLIKKHNILFENGEKLFMLRENSLADLNNNEYRKTYVRLIPSDRTENITTVSFRDDNLNMDIPNSIDWRNLGFHSKEDNQGSCGACYAFSIAQSLEAQIFKRTGLLISLSAQQLIDCSIETGNHGCIGGSLKNTLIYLEESDGLMRSIDYEYIERQNICQAVPELSIIKATSWAILPKDDEYSLKLALAIFGPIAVSINASPDTFQLYSHGIYDDDSCPSNIVNHAMLAVGYTPEYWILKNWWGQNWGDHGYMKLKRGKNLCGIANYAAYVIL